MAQRSAHTSHPSRREGTRQSGPLQRRAGRCIDRKPWPDRAESCCAPPKHADARQIAACERVSVSQTGSTTTH
jgi:hypothetical protein